MENLTIGKLAKRANVNLETLRYYERQGLILEPPRNQSGYRQYSHDAVSRTLFIKRVQALGLCLKQISDRHSLKDLKYVVFYSGIIFAAKYGVFI
jgi:MerR family mercuric resistance operon transcriptional regulator